MMRTARRLVRMACRLYPRSFRRELETDLVEVFTRELDEILARKGRAAGLWLLARTFAAVPREAMREHWSTMRHAARNDARGVASGGAGGPNRGASGSPSRRSFGVNALARDVRYALRSLAARPALSLTAVAVFALAIGVNTAVFSIVEASLLRSLPFAEADRLVDINELPRQYIERGELFGGGATVSLPDFRAWQEQSTLFEGLAVYASSSAVVTGLGDPERVRAHAVSSNLFPLLGIRPLLGRGFLPEEDLASAPRVVVLSHAFWTSRFAQDPAAIGATMTLDGEPFEVVGVMPAGFRFPAFPPPNSRLGATFWVPLGLELDQLARDASSQGGCWVLGRLRDGVTVAEARDQLDQILNGVERSRNRAFFAANVTPLHAFVTGDIRQALMLTMGAVALVLLIGCSNVANLLLARAATRQHEMTVRMAIGASRGQIMAHVLVESTLLALVGGAFGVLLAWQAIPVLLWSSKGLLPAVNEVGMNAGVLAAALSATCACAILAGCSPALIAARRARAVGLAAGASSNKTPGLLGRTADTLVVAQVGLTLVLLVGAGLLGRSLAGLLAIETGFATQRLIVAELQPPSWLYPDERARAAYAGRVLEGARESPGVMMASVTSAAPFGSSVSSSVTVPDAADPSRSVRASVVAATSNYFELAGIPLLRGELFTDGATATPFALIDQAAADALFPGEEPLGRPVATYRWRDEPLTVIGVVGDTLQDTLREVARPHVYVSYFAWPEARIRLVAGVAGDTGSEAERLRQALRAVDPLVPIPRVAAARALVIESLERERFYTGLLGTFAAAAILLAATGIFGLLRHAVTQRTREIGIRMALGANARDILGMVVGRGVRLSLLGIILGCLAASAATRLLASFLFELSPLDPWTYTAAAAVLLVLTIAAALAPAWRGTRTDPLESVRAE